MNVCKFDGPKGWCLGCGRTREECQEWQLLKPFAIKKIEKNLKKRISKMVLREPN
ncbi:MAG: DUF1289 domain-containing protein [Rhodospirillaceae bacterium TMED167]|nr:DUF1289 domain-containing protein [Rhodospirillaceae bacterium]OUW24787.1 MAG: DUF1289 domain-containing protein [Rhodospirillaceae bacterium TMED167]